MLLYAVIIFAITAVGGLVLATNVLGGKLAPWPVSIIHALLGAAGLAILILAVMNGEGGMIPISLGLLVVAALGGFYLASRHMKNQIAPKSIVIIHALVAVVGFLLLTGTVFQFI